MQSLVSKQFTAADPDVQALAEESGNPLLSAALGKLGARK
jgi:hypothetical protein